MLAAHCGTQHTQSAQYCIRSYLMSKEETHEVWELVSVQVLSHIGTGKYVKDYFNRYHFSRVRAVRAVCGPCVTVCYSTSIQQ